MSIGPPPRLEESAELAVENPVEIPPGVWGGGGDDGDSDGGGAQDYLRESQKHKKLLFTTRKKKPTKKLPQASADNRRRWERAVWKMAHEMDWTYLLKDDREAASQLLPIHVRHDKRDFYAELENSVSDELEELQEDDNG